MFETIKWDGTSPIDHEPIVKTALLSYITDVGQRLFDWFVEVEG